MSESLILGGAGLLGGLGANWANARNAREQMEFQERMVGRQEQFQERMANTAVQRQVADLKAANLNPMLAVMRGTPGASTPSGSAAQGARAEMRDPIGPAVASALVARRQKAEIGLIEAQTSLAAAQGMSEQRRRIDIEGTGEGPGASISPVERQRREQIQRVIEQVVEQSKAVSSGRQLTDVQRELAELDKPGAQNRAAFERDLMKNLGVDAPTAQRLVRMLIEVFTFALEVVMELRRARDGKAAEVSVASGLDTGREGPIQKQYAPLVDVNRIVKQFGVTHELPVVANSKAAYGDFSGATDFHTAMNAMVAARENFDRLPAKTREYFGNDPSNVWEFLQDPANDAEAVRLGMFKALPVEKPAEVPQVPAPA